MPTIKLTAGPQGIVAKLYQFVLKATNPPQLIYEENAGFWTFSSFRLAANAQSVRRLGEMTRQLAATEEGGFLDGSTKVGSFGITYPMPMANIVNTPYRYFRSSILHAMRFFQTATP